MKKRLLILAVAGLALASCSNDEVVESVATSDANAISFRPMISGVTRAANGIGLKTAWENGDILYVYAKYNDAKYFQDQFVYDGSTGFFSTNKYYWPNDVSTKNVTFSAFWGATQKTNSPDELASAYTVDADVANHKDLLFAKEVVETKPADGGVKLNFRHMLSQIVVKVANDQPNLKITVSGVRVGYVEKTGEFIYNRASDEGETTLQVEDVTNSAGAVLIKRTDWSNTAAVAANKFDQNSTATLESTVDATILTSFTSWILLPQNLSAATDYSARATSGSVSADPTLNGAYIALKMKIESLDNATDKNVVGTVVAEQWCYWPIGTEWKPGYKYTYTINAGSGGYQPTDQDNAVGLDPVLKGAFIWFTPTCSIDEWVSEERYISDVTYTAGATYSYNVANGTTGAQSFKITGLTPGATVSVAAASNGKLSSITVSPTTVPANGTVTVSGTLADNEGAATTSTITLNEGASAPYASVTVINVVQAAL